MHLSSPRVVQSLRHRNNRNLTDPGKKSSHGRTFSDLQSKCYYSVTPWFLFLFKAPIHCTESVQSNQQKGVVESISPAKLSVLQKTVLRKIIKEKCSVERISGK